MSLSILPLPEHRATESHNDWTTTTGSPHRDRARRCGRRPGSVSRDLFELSAQRRLVVLDGEDVVAAGIDDGLGGVTLAVQCVRGDDRPGDIECVEKRSQ